MWTQKDHLYPGLEEAVIGAGSKVIVATLTLILVSLVGCNRAQPIPVGFAGELTGPHTNLGLAGRDGVQLAVEIINESGGINGRPIECIELIIKNDRGYLYAGSIL